ncbi:dipeptide ABC superfamily ATP binding cassette transporter, permease protein [Sporosarcina newyorkensis 2681]|uniref:Nickel import system permease protein NikB n=1 Tax=Sporosarcina newyorkensis 2681 TaxID=1027292 RepID=F9DQX9_9BACL|nr:MULTISPECIES: nickel ABC transporter permease [Sporosarcina]EGQ26777.1 dipeptide ABC superfamily ATP binding cassette transporter, permease protein [Sporosarcina newyorkensis 2681]MBY0221634.1 ABC transporter permease [Sporosarcina aquimarina]
MVKFVLEHILQLFLVVFSVATLTFLLVRFSPGDPATIMLKANDVPASDEAIYAMRSELGLTDSVGGQYIEWLQQVFTGQWGLSFVSQKPVISELFARLPATLELAFAGLGIMLLVTLVLGISTAVYENGVVDKIGRFLSLLGSAIPTFWLGFLCMYIFSVNFGWLPSMGRNDWKNLILPATTLGLGLGTVYARVLRAYMLEMLQQPFVKASRARGISKKRILVFQVLKHALLPIVTMVGTSFAFMMGGSIIVETIFSWPGLGQYVMESINMRDYPVIQGYVVFAGILFVTIHMIVDFIYLIIDPRLRVR